MPRFKLIIEYAGTRYSGWQIQKNARTVAGELERAIHLAGGRPEFELYGAGRTDAGVHAVAQVAHLQLDTRLEAETLRRRINDELPADINVLELCRAPQGFHARHDAVARSYVYQISRRRSAFVKPYVWWVRDDLDLVAMQAGAERCLGRRDFDAFSADDRDGRSTQVQVDRLDLFDLGALILIRMRGSHFLWRMVRRVVGVLAAIGTGELRPDDISRMLDEGADGAAERTAPPSGLFLERVYYPGDPISDDCPDPLFIGPRP